MEKGKNFQLEPFLPVFCFVLFATQVTCLRPHYDLMRQPGLEPNFSDCQLKTVSSVPEGLRCASESPADLFKNIDP